jgi:hypothetical protein
MKTATLDVEINDTSGLFMDLIKAEFEVVGISKHRGSTIICLEDEEDKDPLPIAELWIDKEIAVSKSLMFSRKEIYEKYISDKPARMAAIKVRIGVENGSYSDVPYEELSDSPIQAQVLTLEPKKPKKNWLKTLKELF